MYNEFRNTFNQFLAASESTVPGVERAKKIEELQQELGRLSIQIQEAAERQRAELNAVATLSS
jgi:hypothetical protein